ncbi:MAG: hypothetical protein C0593_09850 [Marinilabiliales bacterium]|nr:MAG: hypothetical protein C0593_09850 [Marinilabiliales bacterium]
MLFQKSMQKIQIRVFILSFAILFPSLFTMAQEISVSVENQPLNSVLIQVRDSSGVQLSFDDDLLSTFLVTKNQTYNTAEEAIIDLVKDFPLGVEKRGYVFLIIAKEKEPPKYRYSGFVRDKRTGETLPYSHLVINGSKSISDLNGGFSFITENEQIDLRASHLGYYITDTLSLHPGSHEIWLEPSVMGLEMVIISDKTIEKSSQIGQKAGVMRLNKMIGFHLPGNSDNSIFNLLRLQPGILASGESSNDVLIRGAYEGQSKVVFDGFPVFGVKNYNDNIGAVNPLITKDIEVLKSGYNAKYGGRAGGIINIAGINGNNRDFSLQTNINNFTVNSLVEIPLFKKSALTMALRHTYYNLYNPETHSITRNSGNNEIPVDIKVIPSYTFRDANIKYSTQGKNGNLFYISLFGAGDKFSYKINEEINTQRNLEKSSEENNQQIGISLYYGKNWKQGNRSSFLLSLGTLSTIWNELYTITNSNTYDTLINRHYSTGNNISELKASFEHKIAIGKNHSLEFAAALVSNSTALTYDSTEIRITNIESNSARLNTYIQDHIKIGEHIEITPGFRINYAAAVNKLFGEPRITGSLIANEKLRLNFGLGKYYQYISKTAMIDENGQLRYFWITCDNNAIPIINSNQFVFGPSFSTPDFQFSAEFFYTKINNISRFIRNSEYSQEDIYKGEAYTMGLDLYVRKDFSKHSAWVSYTLGQTLERFDYFLKPLYRRAINDQRHEVKAALLLNFNPWYISGNYVFGSGVKLPVYIENAGLYEKPYSRLDISGSFAFELKNIDMEAGISILNLFNTENIKYSNFERITYGQDNSVNLFTEAVPFTPTINFKIFL